jgi:hypothetical protein
MTFVTFKTRKGMSMLYVIIVMTVVFGFASLAMDYGKVQLAKTQLRTAVDSSARHGVQWVSGGKTTALPAVNAAAADNTVNGQPISFTNAQIDIGSWNHQTRVFTVNGTPRTALRVTNSASVPLALGPAIGMQSCTVRASAVAKCVPLAVCGYSGFSFKNNTFVGSYNSAVTVNPTQASASSNAVCVSNGYIGEQNNGDIRGSCIVGPSGSVDPGFSITGGTQTLASAVPVLSDPAWSPTGNPGGVPANYTVSANTTLPSGTYWFTNLVVNRPLTFSGPATLYVNGNIDLNDLLIAYQGVPNNLRIYQLGASRTFDGKNTLKAVIIAPRSAFTAENVFNFYGACVFDTITVKNNCAFFYDESVGMVTGVGIVQ